MHPILGGLTALLSVRSSVAGLEVSPCRYGETTCYTVASQALLSNEWQSNSYNFLATQVWPSSRMAASMIAKHWPTPCRSVCEFGCGPGLPSLTAAVTASQERKVIATDIDELALKLVRASAEDQGLSIETQRVDLLNTETTPVPKADLYLLSDVFESNRIAQSTANVVHKLLTESRWVWVFAQSDRSQRQIFLEELQRLQRDQRQQHTLEWTDEFDPKQRLWLCNVEETDVLY